MAEKTDEQKAPEAAAAETAAAEKAAAEAAKPAAAKPAAAKPATTGAAADKPEPKGHVVIGAAVVLRTEDGSERYLYRGAPVGSGFTKESIKHATDAGLIAKAK